MTKLTLFAEPLPKTNETLKLRTKSMSLNDHVKEALMNGAYAIVQPFLEAVDNKHAVEGSIAADRYAAAWKLREYGKKQGNETIADANLAALDHSLNVACRSIETADGKSIDRNARKLAAIEHAKAQQPEA